MHLCVVCCLSRCECEYKIAEIKKEKQRHNHGAQHVPYAAVPQAGKWNLETDLNMSSLRFKAAEKRESERGVREQVLCSGGNQS